MTNRGLVWTPAEVAAHQARMERIRGVDQYEPSSSVTDYPRPDLPHPAAWYRRRGYPEPLATLHPQALSSYRGRMAHAVRCRKMARTLRDHPDPDLRYWYAWWAGAAAEAYAEARQTRDFGGYGHTCYEG